MWPGVDAFRERLKEQCFQNEKSHCDTLWHQHSPTHLCSIVLNIKVYWDILTYSVSMASSQYKKLKADTDWHFLSPSSQCHSWDTVPLCLSGLLQQRDRDTSEVETREIDRELNWRICAHYFPCFPSFSLCICDKTAVVEGSISVPFTSTHLQSGWVCLHMDHT